MLNLKNKANKYIYVDNMSENEALWAVLEETQEQITYMEENIALCVNKLDDDMVDSILGELRVKNP